VLHDELPADKNPGFRLTPEKAKILADLNRLVKIIEPSDSLIVVLNGHGVHFKGDKTSYFCPVDAVLGNKQNLIPMDGDGGLYPLLEKCAAKSKLLVAGMCRNDPKTFAADSQAAEQIDLSIPETPPAGIAALYSCEAGQKTYFDPKSGSYFFKHLSAAWRGDYSGADELTLDAVFGSVRSRTKKDVFDVSGGLKEQVPEVRRRYDGNWTIPKKARTGDKPGEERDFEIAAGAKMKFCWIPPGKETLGSPAKEKGRTADEAEHPFETRGFWLGKYEVTQKEWALVMGSNPSQFKGDGLPAEHVSWDDCQAFVGKCGVAGMTVTLPHEDAWEYACRGGRGNKQAFHWGNSLNGDKANCNGSSPYVTTIKGDYTKKTTAVGHYEGKAPHPWGLCDMHGNVWEWCENLYSAGGVDRVNRGGSWDFVPESCRSAKRYGNHPTFRNAPIGFRIAMSPVK